MAESSNVRNEKLVSANRTETETTSNDTSSKQAAESSTSLPETNTVIMERLARQVEYYFSANNLAKDTYVSTLRSLNDGYVPVSIIANFGKVKALVPYDALNAVRHACEDYSTLLHVVQVHTQTGKLVPAGTPNVPTVAAVGPVSGQPIPMDAIQTVPASTPQAPAAPVQQTLLLREVPSGMEESDIRELFAFDGCPKIQSLHLDVANCWYVTLDTDSKDEMINVLLALRTKTYASGERVQARMKSGVVASATLSPRSYQPLHVIEPTMLPELPPVRPPPKKSNGGSKNKKKNANNGSNRSRNNNNNSNKNKGKNGNNNNNSQRRNNNGSKQKKKSQTQKEGDSVTNKSVTPQAAPAMGEDNFPSLPTDDSNSKNKIEVERLPGQRPEDDLGKQAAGSDSASTATTTSSSSSSKNVTVPVGGYAAALLKAPKAPQEKVAAPEPPVKNTKPNPKPKTSPNPKATPKPPVAQAPSWGGGRSFADVLRKEQQV